MKSAFINKVIDCVAYVFDHGLLVAWRSSIKLHRIIFYPNVNPSALMNSSMAYYLHIEHKRYQSPSASIGRTRKEWRQALHVTELEPQTL